MLFALLHVSSSEGREGHVVCADGVFNSPLSSTQVPLTAHHQRW